MPVIADVQAVSVNHDLGLACPSLHRLDASTPRNSILTQRMQTVYRPDIDGLRAVAVLSVMIYHLHAAWLPGGYVGVDVFFVISGFVVA